jgi:class 3 adenylate cyclase
MHKDADFRVWLSETSWAVGVRYCRALLWLLPVAATLMDLPLVLSTGAAEARKLEALVTWQAAAWLASGAVVLVNRAPASRRHREAVLYFFCAVFMGLLTWLGVLALWHGGNGLVIYAAGATFIAAVISTPRPVRRPLYALSLLALGLAVLTRTQEPAALVTALSNPLCVVILCLALDRFMYSRSLALYGEIRRAEAERERADRVLYNVLPASIADELKRHDKVNAVKFENLGVLFADIAGFTAYSRSLPPDALVLMLNQVFSLFDERVDRLGLEKIKTIGDAYMVVSYARVASLCELALQMQDAMAAYNRTNGTALAMRIGIHAGPAVAGVIGVKRFLYDVWGDTVNVASRMEAAGQPGSIHVTQAVAQQASGEFEFESRGLIEIRGRGTVPGYWLRGPRVAGAVPAVDAGCPALP